jgi:hypothetical protein
MAPAAPAPALARHTAGAYNARHPRAQGISVGTHRKSTHGAFHSPTPSAPSRSATPSAPSTARHLQRPPTARTTFVHTHTHAPTRAAHGAHEIRHPTPRGSFGAGVLMHATGAHPADAWRKACRAPSPTHAPIGHIWPTGPTPAPPAATPPPSAAPRTTLNSTATTHRASRKSSPGARVGHVRSRACPGAGHAPAQGVSRRRECPEQGMAGAGRLTRITRLALAHGASRLWRSLAALGREALLVPAPAHGGGPARPWRECTWWVLAAFGVSGACLRSWDVRHARSRLWVCEALVGCAAMCCVRGACLLDAVAPAGCWSPGV